MKPEQKLSSELAVWKRNCNGRRWRTLLKDEGSRLEGNYSWTCQGLHLAKLIYISSDRNSGLDHNGG